LLARPSGQGGRDEDGGAVPPCGCHLGNGCSVFLIYAIRVEVRPEVESAYVSIDDDLLMLGVPI
jgi:hypothetical protein